MADDEPGDEGDGFEFNDLPDFASARNKELHAALRAMEREVVQLDAEHADAVDRTGAMKDHLGNVQKETVTTQQLVDARVHEIETEDHLKQLAERERGRFVAELRKHSSEVAELQDKLNLAQNSMFKGNEKMDQFKLKMNWNQEELEQWALAARQKEEDSIALARYAKADESKIRELNLMIEKMVAEAQAKRAELEAEVTDTQSQQIVLDKTADDFRKLHAERQALVREWEDAVRSMQRRDKDIDAAGERFREQKTLLREKQAGHVEREEALQAQLTHNEGLDAQIGTDERDLAKVRQAQALSTAGFDEVTDQIEVMKNTLSKAAAELQLKRDEAANLHALLDEKKGALERKKRALLRAQAELEEHAGRSLSLEQAGKEVSARSRIRKLDDQAQRQRELVYNADFKLQLLERRLSRAQGDRTEAEKRDLSKQIRVLTEEVESATAQHSMLSAQLKRLRNDFAQAKRRNETVTKEMSALTGEIEELQLRNLTSTSHLKQLVGGKEEKVVSHDVRKLELRKLREALSAVVDETFGLENRKAQLGLSMEERQREVGVHADVLRAQMRAAEDERHRVAKMLAEREMRIEKLRQKVLLILLLAVSSCNCNNNNNNNNVHLGLMGHTQEDVNNAIADTSGRIGEYEGRSQHLGSQVVAQQLESDRSRQNVAHTLAELRVVSGGAADAVPVAAELQARVLETSTRARFMVDSLRNLAEAHEGGEFRESVMHLLVERRLVAS
ncbi:hypothetical protein T492DRAFT_996046 [Pavlovales sp. CCMP2436]|nr:hypothetical protein T492DRAFT_996046 [Pavlovales sp. CCMP2436]